MRNIKSVFFILIFLLVIFIGGYNRFIFAEETNATNSDETETNEKKYNIIYPIPELGNCTDKINCRQYCNDFTNKEICQSYAEKKGFYNKTKESEIKILMLNKAKTELGCTDMNNCKITCDNPENLEKCRVFFQKYKPEENKKLTDKLKLVFTKTKEALGCDSMPSCKLMCEKEENKQKCLELARINGLRDKKEKMEETRISPFERKINIQELREKTLEKTTNPLISPKKYNLEDFCKSNPDLCPRKKTETGIEISAAPIKEFERIKNYIRRAEPMKPFNRLEKPEVKGIETSTNPEEVLLKFFINKLIGTLQ